MKSVKRYSLVAAVSGTAAFALVLASAPTATGDSLPCTPQTLGNCPAPGTYAPGGDGVVRVEPGWSLHWSWSEVEKPPAGQVPQYLHVYVTYRNDSDRVLYFTCRGWEDPELSKEWFLRDGRKIGYVAADATLCSTQPQADFTLGPGRSFVSWATFHNVPWKGDRISVEWGGLGSSRYLDPYWPLNP
uniref:Secreted protein n=1 Tax=Streptomyces sp. NBC_00093 TaxID=2975649 RepID=A0AAU1ZU90_9ACTN